MRPLKAYFSFAIALLMVILCLASCAETDKADGDKLKIVTTIFPQYDFVREISGYTPDEVELTMLLPLGSESHDYEPSLSDIAAVGEADVVICVGGETDEWIDSVLEAVERDPVVLRLTNMVPLYTAETVEGMEESAHSHEHHDDCGGHEEYDEHVWTSPKNAADITLEISRVMCDLRPDLAKDFERATSEYTDKLLALNENFKKAVAEGERDTLIFADRFPFRYLAEEAGFSYYAAFEGCSSDAEPALSTIYFLAERVKAEAATAVFTIEFSRGEAADIISEETGADRLTLHSCHNISKKDFDGGKTYLSIMEENLDAVRAALGVGD